MATASSSQINVHTSLPLTVAPGGDLDVNPNNWCWIHCLTIPLETLNTLHPSQKSYKWIRYAIGVVIGAEGALCTSSDLPIAMDYDAALPTQSINLYYHTSNEERQKMFPVDSNIRHTHTTSSVLTDGRALFNDMVAERDRGQCVLTGMGERYCNAIHLLAYSKGDEYIQTFTQCRSRDPTGSDIIQDINSVQNGLFLNVSAHVSLRTDIMAFLMTPNFAMNTADIDPSAPPMEKRCTIHIFQSAAQHNLSACLLGNINVNSPLRLLGTPEDPPAILFDGVYAGAILHHFGTQELKDGLLKTWRDSFYPGGGCGVMNVADFNKPAAIQVVDKTEILVQQHVAHYKPKACHGPDMFDMLMVLPYVMVPHNKLQSALREAKEKAQVVEQKWVQKKVNQWITRQG